MFNISRRYYRIRLGPNSKYAPECFDKGFIGTDIGVNRNLSTELKANWQYFCKILSPAFIAAHPNKTKVGAGLACGALHTIGQQMQINDIVLCADGPDQYRIGEITGGYSFRDGEEPPHTRPVTWLDMRIDRSDLSEQLHKSIGAGPVANIDKYAEEIEALIQGNKTTLISSDESVEDPSEFAMEKHLEEFLVSNWKLCDLSSKYNIYEEDGEIIGQQYPTDTGFIDILAISHDKSELLVVELKRGRASDVVVGQIQRYMGYLVDEVAGKDQTVKGCIIAFKDDLRIRRALRINPLIEFYRYEVTFKLKKIESL